jgi:transglutaminase-like putative cysteine protease
VDAPVKRRSRLLTVLAVATIGAAAWQARASNRGPLLHEPLPPDPAEDLAMHVAIDGNLSPAIRSGKTAIAAPDPRQPPSADEPSYGGVDRERFQPDRDTRRPDVGGYDEPFTPSTAPFKRMSAFDAVRADYSLYVRDDRLFALSLGGPARPEEDAFYADEVVDLVPGRPVRIPSVAAGARVLHARLGVGAEDIAFTIERDGADNWSLDARSLRPVRARLVMELAAPRAAFGGPFGDPSWSALPLVPPLPDNVARDAAVVRAAIGVSRAMSPRAAVARLVDYFRGFAPSSDLPRRQSSIYVDLALSKKGVCRHRAFAFMITAQSLGLPARMVVNEVHAWVEVHDGALWRRVDLGGAGEAQLASSSDAQRPAYDAPADAFRWPAGAARGEEMFAQARARAGGGAPGDGNGEGNAESASARSTSGANGQGAPAQDPNDPHSDAVERAASSLALDVVDADARRGEPLHVRGRVTADGDACPNASVELALRDVKTRRETAMGTLATDASGAFAGGIVVPVSASLGDYDVIARTAGSGACGAGTSVPSER